MPEDSKILVAGKISLLTETSLDTPALERPVGRTHAAENLPRVPGIDLSREIARGGMGRVFAGRETTLDREVAVKVLLPGGNARRFLVESRITARLPHPNIPPIYTLGQLADGSPYLAMKLVRGRTLKELLKARPNPLEELPRFVQIFEHVCQAVGFAHSRGVIHRDLKPANIMVGEFGEVQVMDWGLAKTMGESDPAHCQMPAEATSGRYAEQLEETLDWPAPADSSADELTRRGAVVGTPGYLAPEQARAEAVDARADVFALGSILTEVLTGDSAIRGGAADELVGRAATGDTRDALAALQASGADSELLSLARRCLAFAAADRPADARQVATLVARYRDGFEQRLRQAETAREVAKEALLAQARRRRLVVRLSTAIVLALGLGLAISLWQMNRAISAEGQAKFNAKQAETRRIEADRQTKLATAAGEAERLANEQTQRRLVQIERGIDLLASLVAGINPRNEEQAAEGVYDTLRERANLAVDELNAESVGDPLAVARLQAVLGDTLRELGDYPRAIEILEKAHTTMEQERGAEHTATLTTMNNLALAYKAEGEVGKAIDLFERARDGYAKNLDDDDPLLLNTLGNLGVAYTAGGRSLEAIDLLEHVRDVQSRKLTADDPAMLLTLNNLALAYKDAARLPEAIALLERCRDAEVQAHGPDHARSIIAMSNLAAAHQDAGNLREATALFEVARNARLKRFGPDHLFTLEAQHNLANVYADDRRFTEAMNLQRQTTELCVGRFGIEHSFCLNSVHLLAEQLKSNNKVSEAISLWEETCDELQTKVGPDHLSTVTAQHRLANSLYYAGKVPQAIALLEAVRQSRLTQLGAEHPDTLETQNNLGACLLAAGKPGDSVALLKEVSDARARTLGGGHPDTLKAINNLAVAHGKSGNLPRAIELLESVCHVMKIGLGADHPSTLTAQINLAAAYREIGKLPQAIAINEMVYEQMARRFGADDTNTLIALNNLAVAYHDADRVPEAIEKYRQVCDGLGRTLGAGHPNTLTALRNLASTYSSVGQPQKAMALLHAVHASQLRKQGADHPETLTAVENLGGAYRDAGKLQEAVGLYEAALEARTRTQGGDHPATVTVVYNLASAHRLAKDWSQSLPLMEQAAAGVERLEFKHQYAGVILRNAVGAYADAGRLDDAIRWQHKWQAVVKEQAGAESPAYATELATLGLHLLAGQHWTEAESVCRECLAVREKTQPDAWTTFSTMSQLGGALLGQGKLADAQPMLVQGYEGLCARKSSIPPTARLRIVEAVDRLLVLADALKNADDVAKWETEKAKYTNRSSLQRTNQLQTAPPRAPAP